MAAPSRIGRWEIVRRLGKSMTDVYLAVDPERNLQAVLKLVPLDGSANLAALEAERRGAAIQRELRGADPRMVEIYETGEADGYFYVAMQYVEGRTLAETLRSEAVIDPVRAATIALEICEQLAVFHAQRAAVVHGDIKPSNIHLGPSDTVRLLDFGIAKTLRAGADATVLNFGSPGYCSPERLEHCEVDQSSDLWAVGATLYEMLAGSPPYQAEDTRKLEDLVRSKRSPRALPARCPRALREVVRKALDPNPQARYRSAREFQQDLQAFLEHRLTRAESESRSRSGAGATIEAAREYFTRTVAIGRRKVAAITAAKAAAWFGLGMILWIGGALGWREFHRQPAPHPADPPAPSQPAPKQQLPLAAPYAAAADEVLNAYRESADPALRDFDWQKAEVCLERAQELGDAGDATKGKLALARGYAALQRLDAGLYSGPSAQHMRQYAREQFSAAARLMPQSPDPHLALARVFVYALPNPARAMAEFAGAARLGATLGRREIEQQGDAFRLRAESELATNLPAALQDANRARTFYSRVPGFDQVADHLRDLNKINRGALSKLRRPRRYRR